MNQTRLLICMVALLLICCTGAWLVFGDSEGTPWGAPLKQTDEPGKVADTRPSHDHLFDQPDGPEQPKASAPLEFESESRAAPEHEDPETEGARPEGRDSSAPQDRTRDTPAREGRDASADKGAEQAQPRRLTRAEQEEQRRVERGRPALRRKLARTPAAASGAGDLAKSPEQEEWEQQWHGQGFTPPEMTPTPVQGKIMSEDAREGLAKATVGLISFFPLDGVAGGKLLPVITELETDDKGVFSGEIPASEIKPLNYPPVAIAVTWEGHRIITASPLVSLEVGKPNEFGVIWAPQTPYLLKADARNFTGNLRVISTGELDPQRWHPAMRAESFAYFPAFQVAKESPEEGQTGPEQGFAEVIGTWDGKTTPYVSLLEGPELVQIRRPLPATVVSSNSGGALASPFETLVFENDGFTPISGQVVNADGIGLANAAVSTVGGDLTQTLLTDPSGWFSFEQPPEKTAALHCVHEDYVENRLSPVQPGDSNVTIVLATPRPRIHLFITDKYTQVPLTEIGVKVVGLAAWGPNAGKPLPEAVVSLESADGNFVLEWEFAIKSITLERVGYFPRHYENPAQLQEEGDGRIDVELAPGRNLEVTPREYTNVERADRWFIDADDGPGIRTNWAHHWIEYEVDFGDEIEEGEQGGNFDIELGCTNYGIVDNDYEFKVDVYLDGEKKGTLTILADSLNERTARMSLGALSGPHTIRLVWTNDKWIPSQLDANVRYATLRFLEQP